MKAGNLTRTGSVGIQILSPTGRRDPRCRSPQSYPQAEYCTQIDQIGMVTANGTQRIAAIRRVGARLITRTTCL